LPWPLLVRRPVPAVRERGPDHRREATPRHCLKRIIPQVAVRAEEHRAWPSDAKDVEWNLRIPCVVSNPQAVIRRVTMIRNAMRSAVTAACFIGLTSLASLAASAFEGVWKVKDTAGQPFEITLSSDGAAKATRGEGMTGTWKEEGNAAVITWNTGWTTKITKEGNRYKKTAYRKGQALDTAPTNSSDAERAK
jgi:hypothetical protein